MRIRSRRAVGPDRLAGRELRELPRADVYRQHGELALAERGRLGGVGGIVRVEQPLPRERVLQPLEVVALRLGDRDRRIDARFARVRRDEPVAVDVVLQGTVGHGLLRRVVVLEHEEARLELVRTRPDEPAEHMVVFREVEEPAKEPGAARREGDVDMRFDHESSGVRLGYVKRA